MSLGFTNKEHVVSLNDTADLHAVLYDITTDQPVSADDLVSCQFLIQLPDQTQTTVRAVLNDDGSAAASFNGTTEVGYYPVVAQFTDATGRKKSVRADFAVVNPFLTTPLSASYVIATLIWAKIEDCFDADEEGPWLREVTLNVFNREKMESFLDIALFDINYLNPPTTLGVGDFVGADPRTGFAMANTDAPLLVQGGFLACLRHLMTSYTEQPNPTGAQIAWQDRRDYLNRWATVYAIEFQVYDRMAKLFKRKYLGLGRTSGIISSKAGRLLPAPMRSQFIGRGWW